MRNFRAIAAICGVAAFGAVGCSPPTAESYAARIDREADSDTMLKALRETDPAFYEALRGRASNRLAGGDSPAEVRTEIMTEVRKYTLRQAPNVSAAPAAQLMRVIETERDLIRHLQTTDVGICAAFAMRGLPFGYQPRGEVLTLVNTAATARLTAARAGRETPVRHGEITESDGGAVYAAMVARGAPEAATAALFNGSLPTHPARSQCDTTAVFYDAILDLPSGRRTRVAAVVLTAAAQGAAAEAEASGQVARSRVSGP